MSSRARTLEPKLARAHLGFGRVLLTVGQRRSAKESFQKAYDLDPNDPDIMRACATVLPASPQELALWDRVSKEATHLEPDELQAIRAFTELRRRKQGARLSVLKEAPPTVKIPLRREGQLRDSHSACSIEIQINGGKKRTMMLDTGSSGILMAAKNAERDRVEVIADSKVHGAGDEGPRRAWLGWADSVTIGGVTLANCPIKLTEKKIWRSIAEGIIRLSPSTTEML